MSPEVEECIVVLEMLGCVPRLANAKHMFDRRINTFDLEAGRRHKVVQLLRSPREHVLVNIVAAHT